MCNETLASADWREGVSADLPGPANHGAGRGPRGRNGREAAAGGRVQPPRVRGDSQPVARGVGGPQCLLHDRCVEEMFSS